MIAEVLSFFSLACWFFILLVFLRALSHKLFDFPAFSGFVEDYRLMPRGWGQTVAGVLLVLEGTVVLLAIPPGTRGLSTALATGLLAGYALAIAGNLVRGHTRIECGCGGAAQQLSWGLVVRNALLVALALLALLPAPRDTSTFDGLMALAAGIFLCLIYQFAEVALANRDAQRTLETWRAAR